MKSLPEFFLGIVKRAFARSPRSLPEGAGGLKTAGLPRPLAPASPRGEVGVYYFLRNSRRVITRM